MRLLIALLILFITPLLTYSIYELAHWNKTYPNLSIGPIKVGGLNKAELTQKINQELSIRQNQTFTFEIPQTEVKGFQLNPNLITYNLDQMVETALQSGRTGSWSDQLKFRLQAPFTSSQLEIIYDFDELTTDTLLADMLRDYEKEVLNSQIKFEGGDVYATVSKNGRLSNRDQLRQQIKEYITMQSNLTTATILFEEKQPTITQTNSQNAILKTQAAVGKPLILTEPDSGYQKELTSREIFELLQFEYSSTTNQTEVTIANYKLATLLKDLSAQLDTQSNEGQSQQVGKILIITEDPKPGTRVDIESLAATINTYLFSSGRSELVQIPVIKTEPALTKAVANQYGIKDRLSQGLSSFKNSSAARTHNITTASTKLNGYLVAPGQTFSMYQAIGDIERTTGYTDSVVIKNGRSVPGIGGGVCQVSTSLFRAALQAGLPIAERRPHSYRVSYYEQDSLPGFDAAVYFPQMDFKFRNDTPNHIVIESTINNQDQTLSVSFWGVSDGRKVELSPATITNRRPPPPEARILSESVPKGITRQTEFAAEGATVSFNRTINKDGQQKVESFNSIYRPWQAVYLIGTGE